MFHQKVEIKEEEEKKGLNENDYHWLISRPHQIDLVYNQKHFFREGVYKIMTVISDFFSNKEERKEDEDVLKKDDNLKQLEKLDSYIMDRRKRYNIQPHSEATILLKFFLEVVEKFEEEFDHFFKRKSILKRNPYKELKEENKKHHYYRMIGITLASIYSDYPEFKFKNDESTQKKIQESCFDNGNYNLTSSPRYLEAKQRKIMAAMKSEKLKDVNALMSRIEDITVLSEGFHGKRSTYRKNVIELSREAKKLFNENILKIALLDVQSIEKLTKKLFLDLVHKIEEYFDREIVEKKYEEYCSIFLKKPDDHQYPRMLAVTLSTLLTKGHYSSLLEGDHIDSQAKARRQMIVKWFPFPEKEEFPVYNKKHKITQKATFIASPLPPAPSAQQQQPKI